MNAEPTLTPTRIEEYMRTQPRSARWRQWLKGRRYRITSFSERPSPLVVIAHSFRDDTMARLFTLVIERDWAGAPRPCREAYDQILFRAPELIVVQLRRKNLCRCLGHRHPVVREEPFAEYHEVFGGARVGEMDIAWQTVRAWQGLPLSDLALDTKFLEGSRLEEFRAMQFRLRLLSVFLHETNHLAASSEPETAVLSRSLGFYRDSLAAYVEETLKTLSLTIDRSFSRLGND
ncbi:MAG: hypothetical protein HY508_10500 [Acidobacteria bacterium]|nr:hypothetical protein [Acidobacteriota bacterium]